MVFSSVIFLFFFLPCAWTSYFLSWRKSRNLVLLLGSMVFYVWGEREHVFVLPISILINYSVGVSFCFLDQQGSKGATGPHSVDVNVFRANTSRLRRVILIIGITLNLMLLGFYKYVNFFISNLNLSLAWFDFSLIDIGRVSTPLGISFFTFHALSYVIDTYQCRATPLKNPLRFALYLAVFPKILAGPIIKYHQAKNQLADRSVSAEVFLMGIKRFIIGLGKKVLIANPLAVVADKVFAVPTGELGFDVAWLGIICFTLQIYFDFSGYTDMAIGLGKTFGFEFPENFNFPYVSQSVQEFWRRWHITLSSWFRDYLYIPMGGNRCSPPKHYRNLIVVFLLCGLWHGASWNFIIWGLWYGLFLVLETLKWGQFLRIAPRPLRHFYALAVIVIGWVLFRSDNLFHALQYLKAMSGLATADVGQYYIQQYLDNEVLLLLVIGGIAALPWPSQLERLLKASAGRSDLLFRPLAQGVPVIQIAILGVLFLLSCMTVAGGTHSPFIYFKF